MWRSASPRTPDPRPRRGRFPADRGRFGIARTDDEAASRDARDEEAASRDRAAVLPSCNYGGVAELAEKGHRFLDAWEEGHLLVR